MEKDPISGAQEKQDVVSGTWQSEAQAGEAASWDNLAEQPMEGSESSVNLSAEASNSVMEGEFSQAEGISEEQQEKMAEMMAKFDVMDNTFLATFGGEGLSDEQIVDAKHGGMWGIIGKNVDEFRQENPGVEYPALKWSDTEDGSDVRLEIDFGDKKDEISVTELGERYGDNGAVMAAVASFVYEPKAAQGMVETPEDMVGTMPDMGVDMPEMSPEA